MTAIIQDNIKNTATQSVSHTVKAAHKISTCINENFVEIVELLYNVKGRLILSGLGKSAIVAQKLTATLNSTGTPSVYMHAADALHGDLGIVCPDDALLLFSKSGNTNEIAYLAQYAQQHNILSIGITHNNKSDLAQKTNRCIVLPAIKEADPNELAPTTSIVCQIIVGDAIAICLQQLNGFTVNDFGRYHPSGLLGQLTNKSVEGIYKSNPKPCVNINTPIKKVIIEISQKRLGATAVVDENKQLCGIITDGDLRRMMEKNNNFLHLKASEIMSKNPTTCPPNTLLNNALKKLESDNISQIIVSNGKIYLGIVHLHDILKRGIC